MSPRRGSDASGPCGRLPSARRAAHWREGPLSGGRASGGIPRPPHARRLHPGESSPPSSSSCLRRRSQRAHSIHGGFPGRKGDTYKEGSAPPVPVVRETYVDCFRPAEKRLRRRPEADAGLSTWRRSAARRGEGTRAFRAGTPADAPPRGARLLRRRSTPNLSRRRSRSEGDGVASGSRLFPESGFTGSPSSEVPLPSGKTRPAAPRKRASSPTNLELIPTHKGVSHNVRDRCLLPRASKARSEQAHSTLVGTIRRKSGREGQHERGTKISQLSS